MSALAAQGAVVGEAVPAGSVLPLTVTVSLPVTAGNDTMTDRVGFSLEIGASADLAAQTGGITCSSSVGAGSPNRPGT